MAPVKFTAVIPAFNAEATLADAVESVLRQTEQDFELVIVDDGSRDGTLALARSFESDPRVRTVHQANRGLAASRNVGIAAARGEYVALLDSDDLWMPRFLEVLGAALDADPGAAFAYTDGWVLDDVTRRIRRSSAMSLQRPPMPPPREAADLLRILIERNFVIAEAVVRRAALDRVGAFDESLPAVEDYELWLRLLAHGYRGVRPAGLLLVRRERSDSMSKDHALMYRAHREVWRLVTERHPAPEDVKATARRRIEDMDRLVEIAEGSRPEPLSARLRPYAGAVKRRLLSRRIWLSEPPAEVRDAFPGLFAG